MNHVQGDQPAMPDRAPWSVRFAGDGRSVATPGEATTSSSRELVVFAPPGTTIERAFARLRDVVRGDVARHLAVRLVAYGATLEAHRPEWLAVAARDGALPCEVVLTELDAYLPSERTSLLRESELALSRWLAAVMRDAVPGGLPADQVFWASAMRRAFAPSFASWPLARGLAVHHGADRVECLDAHWPAAAGLAALLAARGGELVLANAPVAPRWWSARVAGHVAVNLAGAAAVRAREFVRERASRARLGALRAQLGDRAQPDVWMGLLGEWPRSCRHVVEGVGGAAQERGQTVGVLLHESLLPGSRQHDVGDRTAVFPALDHPLLDGRVVAVEQCAAIERPAAFARNLAGTAWASARVAWRLARTGSRLELGPLPIALAPHLTALARLATFDVLRAREAHFATRELLARRDLNGRKVVWPHASVAHDVVPDLMLQRAGAHTFDLVHGALAEPLDFITHARTYSGTAIWWTDAEVDYVRPYVPAQRAVGGYLPRSVARRGEARSTRDADAARPLRVLVVSNYATPTLALGGAFTRECYQDALLDAVAAATRAVDAPLELRWRPHPYDDKPRVEASRARWCGAVPLAMSTEPDGLQGELAWADVVISSISSSIVEAAVHPVALFVHDVPLHESEVLMHMFDPSRRFGGSADLPSKFTRYVAAHRAGDPLRHAPEEALREAYFGPARTPRDLGELLWPSDARATDSSTTAPVVTAPVPSELL